MSLFARPFRASIILQAHGARILQVTEEARKRGYTADAASQKVKDAQDYAQQTADAGSAYVKDGQKQGESAWQKVKEVVTDTVDKVTASNSYACHTCFAFSFGIC